VEKRPVPPPLSIMAGGVQVQGPPKLTQAVYLRALFFAS